MLPNKAEPVRFSFKTSRVLIRNACSFCSDDHCNSLHDELSDHETRPPVMIVWRAHSQCKIKEF